MEKAKRQVSKKEILVKKIYSNPKYKGKHVVIVGGKIFSTRTGSAASKMLEKLLKKYPAKTPTLTYIPKAETLILIFL